MRAPGAGAPPAMLGTDPAKAPGRPGARRGATQLCRGATQLCQGATRLFGLRFALQKPCGGATRAPTQPLGGHPCRAPGAGPWGGDPAHGSGASTGARAGGPGATRRVTRPSEAPSRFSPWLPPARPARIFGARPHRRPHRRPHAHGQGAPGRHGCLAGRTPAAAPSPWRGRRPFGLGEFFGLGDFFGLAIFERQSDFGPSRSAH